MRRRRGRRERYAEARGGREQASEVSSARRERQQRRGEKASDERAEQHRAEGEQRKAFPRFCLGSSFLAWSSWKVARSRGSFSSQIAGPAPVPPPAATIAATTTAPPRRSRALSRPHHSRGGAVCVARARQRPRQLRRRLMTGFGRARGAGRKFAAGEIQPCQQARRQSTAVSLRESWAVRARKASSIAITIIAMIAATKIHTPARGTVCALLACFIHLACTWHAAVVPCCRHGRTVVRLPINAIYN